MATVFLHGLDSSSQGNKAKWFRQHFPSMVIPDFKGSLEVRMEKLTSLLAGENDLVLVGSSFGGLMATIYALQHEDSIRQLVLLAPALNFPDFQNHIGRKVDSPVHLYIGRQDIVCPPDIVIPLAQEVYADLSVHLSDDDHLLRDTFSEIDWTSRLIIKDQGKEEEDAPAD